VRLKEAIERQLNIPANFKIGGPGSLDVLVDGERIFSKKEERRMPQPAEIIGLIKSRG
jgi:hypothetical protein